MAENDCGTYFIAISGVTDADFKEVVVARGQRPARKVTILPAVGAGDYYLEVNRDGVTPLVPVARVTTIDGPVFSFRLKAKSGATFAGHAQCSE